MSDKRWTEVLCQKCGGNGVVKIPGGVSECPRCLGRCYDPDTEDKDAEHTHVNIRGETFTDADLKNAGQDWGEHDAKIASLTAQVEQQQALKEAARAWLEYSAPTREDYMSDEAYAEAGRRYDRLAALAAEGALDVAHEK